MILGEPWDDLRDDPAYAGRFAARLASEVRPGHVLDGVPVTVIARCGHCDEVMLTLPDGRYALVHLTWGTAAPPYPLTEVRSTAVEAVAAAADHCDALVAAAGPGGPWHAVRPGRREPVCGGGATVEPVAALWTAAPPSGVTRCPECALRASPDW